MSLAKPDQDNHKTRSVNSVETKDTLPVETITPYANKVSGHELLSTITALLKTYVYLPDSACEAIAAWCLGTYCMDSWSLYPKLLITSPEKRCGKTTLIDVMEALVYQGLAVSNTSSSAVFRIIDEYHPTLFLDEADTFTKDNLELNGIINAGHRKRTAHVMRVERYGNEFKAVKFSVWSPMVIAGIGNQRDTLHDRSLHIEMERKLPDERITKVPVDLYERQEQLRCKCLRWALDNKQKLKQLIDIPNHGNDRAQDNWQPLLTIAHAVGDNWEKRLLNSYSAFMLKDIPEENTGITLLRDIQKILINMGYDKISSSELVNHLIKIEDSPWCEWKHGQPMTQNSLSRLLKPFKIKSKVIRINGQTPRGFEAKQFENAFKRYIPLVQSATMQQAHCGAPDSGFQSATRNKSVALSSRLKPSCNTECCTVALQKGAVETII